MKTSRCKIKHQKVLRRHFCHLDGRFEQPHALLQYSECNQCEEKGAGCNQSDEEGGRNRYPKHRDKIHTQLVESNDLKKVENSMKISINKKA